VLLSKPIANALGCQKLKPTAGMEAGVSTWQGLAMQFDLLRRQVGDEWKD
jgi:hypothetical protein